MEVKAKGSGTCSVFSKLLLLLGIAVIIHLKCPVGQGLIPRKEEYTDVKDKDGGNTRIKEEL